MPFKKPASTSFDDMDPDALARSIDDIFDPRNEHPLDQLDPLGGDITEDAGMMAKERIKRKADADRTDVELLNDSGFYTCIVFQTSGQLREFIKKTGWKLESEYWINGLLLAKEMGIDIQPIPDLAERERLWKSRSIPKAQKLIADEGLTFIETGKQ